MAQVTAPQILHQGYTAFERRHTLPGYVRKAVWALMACRTAVLGGHRQRCPEGHGERIWDHSCRHRRCPPCAWLQIERWLVRQQARLWACEPSHAIFTMPHERNDLWLAHVAVMSGLLFASVHDTRLALLSDAKYLGAKPGSIATRHTWSQTLSLHPHLHGVVTGGGWQESGPWVAVSHGFLRPMGVVMAVFRGKLRAAICQGLTPGTLQWPAGQRQPHVENRLNTLGRQQWNVHIRARYASGPGVLISRARYRRGGPIAAQRLVAGEGQRVVCRDEERAKGPGDQAKQRTMCVPIEPFGGRFWRHVPPGRAVLVRSGGLYAHTYAEALAHGRQPLGQDAVEGPGPEDGPSDSRHGVEADPERCPVCGQRLVCTALMPRAGAPPPAKTEWEQVA